MLPQAIRKKDKSRSIVAVPSKVLSKASRDAGDSRLFLLSHSIHTQICFIIVMLQGFGLVDAPPQ